MPDDIDVLARDLATAMPVAGDWVAFEGYVSLIVKRVRECVEEQRRHHCKLLCLGCREGWPIKETKWSLFWHNDDPTLPTSGMPCRAGAILAPDGKEEGFGTDEEDQCGKPCDIDPEQACDECAEYWQRMRAEGYWIDGKGWTTKTWLEMLK